MATSYLTPGVYVEEVPSANKPIEGVGTSIAAFVGLAPGRPGQHADADLELDPVRQDLRRPERARRTARSWRAPTWRTPSTASSRTAAASAGSSAWAADGRPASAWRRCPPPRDGDAEAFRAVALTGVDGDVEGRDTPSRARCRGRRGRVRQESRRPYKLAVTAGRDKEEYDGLTAKKGRNNIATKVNAASKLIKIEETGAALPDVRARRRQLHAVGAPAAAGRGQPPSHFEGDVARRKGMGGLAAVDEVTMVVMPDMMTLAKNGDDVQLRDLQGKMIAHCENDGRPHGDPRRAAGHASRRTSSTGG